MPLETKVKSLEARMKEVEGECDKIPGLEGRIQLLETVSQKDDKILRLEMREFIKESVQEAVGSIKAGQTETLKQTIADMRDERKWFMRALAGLVFTVIGSVLIVVVTTILKISY